MVDLTFLVKFAGDFISVMSYYSTYNLVNATRGLHGFKVRLYAAVCRVRLALWRMQSNEHT